MPKNLKKPSSSEWVKSAKAGVLYARNEFFQNQPGTVASYVKAHRQPLLLGSGPKRLSCRITYPEKYSPQEIQGFLRVGAGDINRSWPSLKALIKHRGVILAYEFKGEVLAIVEKNPDYIHAATQKYWAEWLKNNGVDVTPTTKPDRLDKIYELISSMNIVYGGIPSKIEESVRKMHQEFLEKLKIKKH